jgi:uncharacterized protein
MPSIERRNVAMQEPVSVEKRDGQPSKITGYAAVFYDGTRDTEYELWPGVFERIAPNAFDQVLLDNYDTRALFNHDPNMLLGRVSAGTLKLERFARGLRYIIKPTGTQRASDVMTDIEAGNVDGSSFGFVVDSEEWSKEDDGREIRTIQSVSHLYDVGPVTFPAYKATSAGLRAEGDVTEARSSYDKWHQAKPPEAPEEPAPEVVAERLASYAERAAKVVE